ncbi:fasciclin domain-containing protein [Sphingomonas dokdonensis]|uniref:Immunogenic protein MPT70 n=1 Tax=Sphingomonas dokdonensis TaxID=344880 RepID=A0A245ZL50_9SPHN|nr:fasciclin domain-containing protein [Sphingomonas dokdonensis]OWK30467.1 immunogenic protein MPT70 precursor [Sphingomonas dokdonensis]
MSVSRALIILAAGGLAATAPAFAKPLPVMAPAAASASKTIVENASAMPNLSTLVAAVKAAGLVDTLNGTGPFTVFAPTNAAFSALPAGTVDTLLKPENKPQLTSVLTYHVVAGKVTAADLAKQIKAGGGTTMLTTVQGGQLKATMSGGKVMITDAAGGSATVTMADAPQSNGVVHVINKVLMPGG